MIYFIQEDNERGLIKIGHTKSPIDRRLESLQTGSPDELKVIGVIEGNQQTENQIHMQFKHAQYRIEWFYPEPDLLAFIDVNSVEPDEIISAIEPQVFEIDGEVYYTPPDVAQLLNETLNPKRPIHRHTVWAWCKSGQLPAIDGGPKSKPRYLIPEYVLDNFTPPKRGRRPKWERG